MRSVKTVMCVALVLGMAGAVLAQDGRLTINVQDLDQKPIEGASIEVTPAGAAPIMLTSDAGGSASTRVPIDGTFTVHVKASGSSLRFKEKIGRAYDSAIARVIMSPPRLGKSTLAEFRRLRTGEDENPERDSARFNFVVVYYKDKTPIDGATIDLTNTDGSPFKTLTTDDQGKATVLVREGTRLNVKVTATGYHDYYSKLAPGLKATVRQVNVRMRRKV